MFLTCSSTIVTAIVSCINVMKPLTVTSVTFIHMYLLASNTCRFSVVDLIVSQLNLQLKLFNKSAMESLG